MYLYKIGYYSMEESDYIELQHDKKFSDDEMSEMIAEATIDTIRKEGITKYTFQCIFSSDNFIQFLKNKFNFKELEYELKWSAFGWASIYDKNDWKHDRDESLNKITDAVKKAGFNIRDDVFVRQY